MGKELVDILKNQDDLEAKKEAIYNFREMLEFTINHPMMREIYGRKKEYMMLSKELPYMLMDYLETMD